MVDFTKIKALAFDIDGVMTDGGLLGFNDGNLLRIYNAKDTMGLRLAEMADIKLAVITGGRSPSIPARFETCGVNREDVYLGSRDKMESFRDFCSRHGFTADEVAYVGDDIPDVPVIVACGLGVAPADAVEEAREAADFVSPFPGGKGCIRHLVEQILKSQGKWKFDLSRYVKTY